MVGGGWWWLVVGGRLGIGTPLYLEPQERVAERVLTRPVPLDRLFLILVEIADVTLPLDLRLVGRLDLARVDAWTARMGHSIGAQAPIRIRSAWARG